MAELWTDEIFYVLCAVLIHSTHRTIMQNFSSFGWGMTKLWFFNFLLKTDQPTNQQTNWSIEASSQSLKREMTDSVFLIVLHRIEKHK